MKNIGFIVFVEHTPQILKCRVAIHTINTSPP